MCGIINKSACISKRLFSLKWHNHHYYILQLHLRNIWFYSLFNLDLGLYSLLGKMRLKPKCRESSGGSWFSVLPRAWALEMEERFQGPSRILLDLREFYVTFPKAGRAAVSHTCLLPVEGDGVWFPVNREDRYSETPHVVRGGSGPNLRSPWRTRLCSRVPGKGASSHKTNPHKWKLFCRVSSHTQAAPVSGAWRVGTASLVPGLLRAQASQKEKRSLQQPPAPSSRLHPQHRQLLTHVLIMLILWEPTLNLNLCSQYIEP